MKNSLLIMFILLVFPFLMMNYNKEDNKIDTKAREMLSSMTLDEKIGQMFFVRHPKENQIKDIQDYNLGGYLFYSSDFASETKDSFKNKIDLYQKESNIPLLMGVDEEGGKVVRISKYLAFREEPFKSSRELYKDGGLKLIEKDTTEKCKLLKELGLNTNFAPVVDISTNVNDYMFDRSLGKNRKITSDYAKKVIKIMKDEKIVSVLKHFPGYGNNTDTHEEISYDERSLKELENKDFWPFTSGISAGANMILINHNILSQIDSKPASISLKMHELLRDRLNFDGVIITDALDMKGLTEHLNKTSPSVAAILAGNDMLCTTNYHEEIPEVKKAIQDGIITEKRINESVLRILKMKIKMGIINQ